MKSTVPFLKNNFQHGTKHNLKILKPIKTARLMIHKVNWALWNKMNFMISLQNHLKNTKM